MKELDVKVVANEKLNGNLYQLKFTSQYLVQNSIPGQFVQLKCRDGIDPFLRRPFSIGDVDPKKKLITIYYLRVGRGTTLLADNLKRGEMLSLLGPLGNGFEIEKISPDVTYLVGGGIGSAPLLYLARSLKKENLKIFLGAATHEDLEIRHDFLSLINTKVYFATEDGSLGYEGLVTEPLEGEIYKDVKKNPNLKSIIYGCGPFPMLGSLKELADSNNIPCQISLEEKMACGIGVCLGCAINTKKYKYYPKVCSDGPVFWSDEVEIK